MWCTGRIGLLACLLAASACGAGAEEQGRGEGEATADLAEPMTGGVQTANDYVVGITDLDGDSGECSGILLNPRTVLTAAHCVAHESGRRNVKVVRVKGTQGGPGSFTYKRKCAADLDKCKMSADFIVQSGSQDYYASDYALVVTRDVDMPLAPSQSPLVRAMNSFSTGNRQMLSLGPVGEGDDGGDMLRMATINVEKWEWWLASDKIYLHDTVKPCHGDSGAPMLYETASVGGNSRPVVAAILSGGEGTIRDCMSVGTAFWGTTFANWGFIKDNAKNGCRVVAGAGGGTYLDCSF